MYQQITIVGYLGNDPEMRFMPNGQAVTSFSVATSNKYTSNTGQRVDETTWFRVSVWGAQAESCNQYLKKGRPVLVIGRLRPDPQTGNPRIFNRQDGTPAASFEVTAQQVKFLPFGSRGAGGGEDDFGDMHGSPETDDEIPF
ncbi:MAG: single-stranded DNA-binding protein [Brevefilum fermentans]|jgi:single-strand DNA-binding protein|uniref:Single-stranded DNA-binding protein n=1 Tax=Candidatus Brevifilum fermentans TaxID=1986204 RepID=A0A1Y6K6F2_9CHLR|nr:single-stranded DNA-binding protein [Brevefilum fermentans]MDI9565657.1 single-stranded DNA-binding protein [Chloroflexota bacterium]SMX55272.1 Single-stranded DNA-binding protein [Brevefilum fermentans]HOM66816.1 single-stranded DNA-binding protein [Brevefilum fermentans]